MSVLLHEMMHHWQEYFGSKQGRAKYSYHDKEWAAKMRSVGLMPSNTGAIGGKETGTQMDHYVIPGGLFAQAFADLAKTGWKLNLQSAPTRGAPKGPDSKTKFSCPCGQNAWGKPDLAIRCDLCNARMRPELKAGSYDQQQAAE